MDRQFRVDEFVKFVRSVHVSFHHSRQTGQAISARSSSQKRNPSRTPAFTGFPSTIFACPAPSIIISSVTRLRTARYPLAASLGSILAFFPNVTHLRLGSPSSLKYLAIPYMSKVRVLILDAPLYMVASEAPRLRLPTSVLLWYIPDALEHGLLKSTANIPRRIIMNAERSDLDNARNIALSCQNHSVAFECRRVHPSYWKSIHVESRHWDHEWS
jgi:hypothetical protein